MFTHLIVVNGCLASPNGYGCGTNSLCSPGNNTRNCTCRAGYARSASYTDVNQILPGNTAATDCSTTVDMCAQFSCVVGEAPSVNCTNDAPDVRTCECPIGYFGTETITGPRAHVGCARVFLITLLSVLTLGINLLVIDLCNKYGCSGDTHAICTNGPAEDITRICTCQPGWEGSETLYNATIHTACVQTDMCQKYVPCNFLPLSLLYSYL
jgi:hypothetical protein